MDTDVLIATRERDLYHMLLLLPNSAVIAFESNHLHYPTLNVLAEVASLYYIPVVNTTSSLPRNCEKPFSARCVEELQSQPVHVQFGQLHNYMRLATTHVHVHKYKR